MSNAQRQNSGSVYLLLGPEMGKKSSFIKSLYSSARKRFGDGLEMHRCYPFELESGELLAMLQSNSLFAEHQFIILSQAEQLQQGLVNELVSYLQHPSDQITLLIISSEMYVHKKITALVPKDNQIKFWELFENQKQDWLKNYFSSRNMRIDDETIALILDLVENNTQEMKMTCDQFTAYISAKKADSGTRPQDSSRPLMITEEDVEQFMYHSRRENVFSLFEKMTGRDLRGSLEIYRSLHLSGEAYPVQLFAGLLWQFRRLHAYAHLLREQFSPEEARKKTSVMGKRAEIRGKHNQQIYDSAARNYSLSDIRRCIALLQEYDILIRSIRADLEPVVMELMIYTIVIRSGQKPVSGSQYYGLIGADFQPVQQYF